MSSEKRVAKLATFIAVCTLISKVLGVLRESGIGYVYGATSEVDAYKGAYTITMISMQILGGALNTGLVPIFTEIKTRHGKKRERAFFSKLYSGVFFLTIAIGLVLFFGAKPLVKLMLWNFPEEHLAFAAKLVRISSPIVLFMGMTYVFQGFLHSEDVFGPGALMGIPFNLCYFIYLAVAPGMGMEGLMMASIAAAFMQAAIQIPAVLHRGNSLRLVSPVGDEYLKKTITMLVPIAIGTGVTQIDVVVDKILASGLEEGSITVLDFASRLNEGIVAIFIAALVTVLFPMLSRAFEARNKKLLTSMIERGITIIFLITIPASFGIWALSSPLVSLVFERGQFGARETFLTTSALVFYCVGMTGIGVRMYLSKVFYSLKKTTIPMYNGILCIIFNIILNLILVRYMAHAGLALATGLAINIAAIILYKGIRIRFPELNVKKHAFDFTKITAASALMALGVNKVYGLISQALPASRGMMALSALLSVFCGVVLYTILILLFRVEEMKQVLRSVRKRFH